MKIKLSDGVYKKYFELLDSTWDIFGVDCKLIFDDARQVVAYSDNTSVSNSINAHRRSPGNWSRGNSTIQRTKSSETVRMKVYWNPQDWKRLTNNIVIPENGIGTLFFADDLSKVMEAKSLIVHEGIQDLIEIEFTRDSEIYPVSLQQDKHFACTWGRV